MGRARWSLAWGLGALVLLGCGGASTRRESAEPVRRAGVDVQADVGRADIEAWDALGRTTPASMVVREDGARDRFATRRIEHGATTDRFAPHLGAGPRVDVRFHRAPLSSVLRLLAEHADLGLVVAEGVDAVVSLELRHVGAIEAMRAVAEAHGVQLDVVGRTVIARGR